MKREWWLMRQTPGSDSPMFDTVIATYRWRWQARWALRRAVRRGGSGYYVAEMEVRE